MEAKQCAPKQPMGHWRNQRGNLKLPGDKRKQKHNSKLMGHNKSSSKTEVYSHSSLPQETRKTTNKQCNLTPKGTRKRRINKTQKVEGKKS